MENVAPFPTANLHGLNYQFKVDQNGKQTDGYAAGDQPFRARWRRDRY